MNNELGKEPELIRGGVISIETATHQTARWRSHFQINNNNGNIDNGNINDEGIEKKFHLVKGFFIPMHDLQCLLDYYGCYHPSGVRAYVAAKEEDSEGKCTLHLLLVPATKTEDFWNKGPRRPGAVVDDESSIYDFTAPCPDTCSAENPLNSGPIVPPDVVETP